MTIGVRATGLKSFFVTFSFLGTGVILIVCQMLGS